MNQEDMSNEDRRVLKLMEQMTNKDSLEDKRVEKIKQEQASHVSLEDLRIEKIKQEQANHNSLEDKRVEKIKQESSTNNEFYNTGAEIYNEAKPAPVDDSLRVDQIDSQRGRVNTVSSVSGVSGVRPVQASLDPVNFADALEQWRYMSEKYRSKRLAKENPAPANPPANKENKDYLYNTNQFQKEYETDKVNIFNSNTLTTKDNTRAIDDLVGLVHRIEGAKENELLPYPHSNHNDYHQIIQNDLRERIISRLSTANLDISPELVDEYENQEHIHSETGVLRVSDVMTRNVISVIDSMTIEQVATIFNNKKITSVPVIHYKTKQPIGMITMADIVEHIFHDGTVSTLPIEGNGMFLQESLAILEKPIRDLMHTDLVEIDSEVSVKDACKLMTDHELHRVIITKNNRVKGIFTSFDAVRVLAKYDIKL